ncbi:polysaccharide biosynthesis/export family protein [Sphingobium estronivorans]|uniref:polysaccharide biosynthesis/export family protein n=1 Tax=Sphingobium estronivorans TaxID=1577690 RepID=UPI001F084BB0|nr:polysaccharide biosynthesis/export family protein [Sphingobium estronivorans]
MHLKGLFRSAWLMIGLLPVAPVAGQQAVVPAAPAAAAQATLSDGYVLGPGDVIELSVMGRDDYRARLQLQTDGVIELPLIGNVVAANKTVLQLKEEVRNRLKSGGYFANPIVNVTIATYASRYVVVLGEVASPGIVPIDRAYRISEILARVGGAKDNGGTMLTITRASGEEIRLNVKDIATGGADKDPLVNAGDKIFLAEAATFYVYGQVNAPGNYRIEPGMTLRMAIARSGGLTALGSEKRAKVTRDGHEVRVGLDDVVTDKDVIVVGQKFF